MNQINPIGNNQPVNKINSTRRVADQPVATGNEARPADSVQLSDQAQLLAKLKEVPEVRQDLVNSVRNDILSGNYETDEKFDVVVDRLAEDLFG